MLTEGYPLRVSCHVVTHCDRPFSRRADDPPMAQQPQAVYTTDEVGNVVTSL